MRKCNHCIASLHIYQNNCSYTDQHYNDVCLKVFSSCDRRSDLSVRVIGLALQPRRLLLVTRHSYALLCQI